MRNVLQENQVLPGKNHSTLIILIHGQSHQLQGQSEIQETEFSRNFQSASTASAFKYVIAFDHSNFIIHGDDLNAFEHLFQQSRKGVVTEYEFRIFNADGKCFQIRGKGLLRLTDRRRLPDLAFESTSLGMIWLQSIRDEDNNIKDFSVVLTNKVAENQLGFSPTGKTYKELQPRLSELSADTLVHVAETGAGLSERIHYSYDQRRAWLKFTLGKFEDGVFIVIQDDAKSKQEEESIRQQALLFTKVIEASPDIIEIINLESGRSAYINKMLLEELEYPFEEIKKVEREKSLKELIHPDDTEVYHQFLEQIKQAKNEDTIEVQVRWQSYKKGWKWYKTRARIFERDADGGPLKLLAFSQDITLQKQAEEERRKHQLLKDLEKARTAFFSNVSHEFRTPLTLLLAPIQELLTKENLPKADMDRLQMAYRNALRLQKLVNTLLDFSRIEAGKLDAVFRPTDISTFTADLVSNFRAIVEHAGLKLIVKCPPVEEPVYLNREMYEKIIFNLVSNAFKFTFKGKIEVIVKDNKNHVKVIVRDTGIGIEPSSLDKIFDRFVRIPTAKARTYEGSGIGLALVRELVTVHRGTIKVLSEPGEGTAFIITLSKGKDHLPAKSIFESVGQHEEPTQAPSYIEEVKGWTTGFSGIEDNRARRKAKELSKEKPRVLVIDDNADMRTYLKNLLQEDYSVSVAENGKAALESISPQSLPDLILTDVMMPEVDGYRLLQAIKRNDATKHIPVILVSARAGDESKIEGLGFGADDYLVKPFSAKEMLARIEARIEIARAQKLIRESLTDQNKSLEEQVNEKTKDLQLINSTLIEKNSQLESLNSDLSTFAFVASHDLREPLRKIELFTRLLVEREVSNLTDRGKEISKKILASAERLNQLIDDILTYSHTHPVSQRVEDVDLNKVLSDVIDDLSNSIAEKNALIEHDALPVIRGNNLQFAQLFQNLISNSLKFTRTDTRPEVHVTAAIVDGDIVDHPQARKGTKYLRIEVRDNGIGFEPKYQDKIFQIFQRLHERTKYSGTGMGLAICKKIVERYHGFIGSKSEPGKGATFSCYLPAEMLVQ